MTSNVCEKVLVDTAATPSSGRNPAFGKLYDDGTLVYTTELAVAITRWQTVQVPVRRGEGFSQLALVFNETKGLLHAVVTYSKGTVVFATLDRFPQWHVATDS